MTRILAATALLFVCLLFASAVLDAAALSCTAHDEQNAPLSHVAAYVESCKTYRSKRASTWARRIDERSRRHECPAIISLKPACTNTSKRPASKDDPKGWLFRSTLGPIRHAHRAANEPARRLRHDPALETTFAAEIGAAQTVAYPPSA
jgi:hypothetical protein